MVRNLYALFIDSLYEDMEDRGYKCSTVAKPWSTIVGKKAFGHVISINRCYFRDFLLNKALGILKSFGRKMQSLECLIVLVEALEQNCRFGLARLKSCLYLAKT